MLLRAATAALWVAMTVPQALSARSAASVAAARCAGKGTCLHGVRSCADPRLPGGALGYSGRILNRDRTDLWQEGPKAWAGGERREQQQAGDFGSFGWSFAKDKAMLFCGERERPPLAGGGAEIIET